MCGRELGSGPVSGTTPPKSTRFRASRLVFTLVAAFGLTLSGALSSGDALAWEPDPSDADAVPDPTTAGASTLGGEAGQAPPDVPANASATPAVKYASLGQAACEAELKRRKIPYVRVDSARGVVAPVRLRGPLSGVTYHSQVPERSRATSPYEIFDCRLVLALDDFSKVLSKLDVVEVVHYSAYRPPPTRGWAPGRIGSRHGGALALDAGKFVKKDGTVLDVEKHFHGRIGAKTCGPGTGPNPTSPESLALRQVACDSASNRLFNVILTPNYNWPHRNHFHLEVTSGVKWFIVH